MAMTRLALFVDGDYLCRARWRTNQNLATPDAIKSYILARRGHAAVRGMDLYRIFYYHSPVVTTTEKRPISDTPVDFSTGPEAARRQSQLDELALSHDFAMRRGESAFRGWRIRPFAIKQHRENGRPLTDDDFAPDLAQKGVDVRLALDLAMVAMKRQADIAILIAGDTDFVPAMKLARREGLRVYLDLVAGSGRDNMREHSDLVFEPLPES